MSTLQQYRCPCCDGAIEFDPSQQKMVCPFCDTEFDPEALEAYDSGVKSVGEDSMSWDSSSGEEWTLDEESGLVSYICESCGGEVIGDTSLAATTCPFCDSHIIMKGQLSGQLKPDYIIPFKRDKESAKVSLKLHYHGKTLLPKAFRDENHIDEIKGVYVPVWLFDADADGSACFKATDEFVREDDRYIYTITKYYSAIREGSLSFRRVPVDGSTKMEDALMESIEPYVFDDAVDFRTAYLSGYLADKYDVSAEESIVRANERIKTTTVDMLRSTVTGYDSVVTQASSVSFRNGCSRYALFPVWLLNTSWEGKKYTFAMNGQTGKFVGDLPLDKKAYMKWLFGLTAAISSVAFILQFLLWM